jgi:4-hydroxy-tetrahydrodipicolinate reductase
MGREIERILIERGHSVEFIIDEANAEELTPENIKRVDVAFEFTTPDTAPQNLKRVLEAGGRVVCGTTGWLQRMGEMESLAKEKGGALFYASNFSIGVNVFVAMQKYIAKIMNAYPQYDVTLQETHHIHKLDSPSGTAITIANAITDNLERKQSWKETACLWQHEDESMDVARNAEVGTQFQSHKADELEVVAFRRGEVPGIHTVVYDSDVDTITMTHSAKSRRGFALGAVIAAEWMSDGKKGVYTMTDLMNF